MRNRHPASRLIVPSCLCSALLLVSCSSEDHTLGKQGNTDGSQDAKASDAGVVTCEQGGTTYQVGETITLSACTTCVCQPDGTVGMCTGACPPDAAIAADAAAQTDAAVTCTYNGTTYLAGDIIPVNACTSCVCQSDGTVGMCTGDCPPDAAIVTDGAVTCTQDGKTYQVGERVGSGCVSCVCQPDGTWGECTGACPPDGAAPTDTDNSPAAMCTRTQGEIVTSQCCLSAGDFPSTCLTGACGCAPANSHAVSSCSCPAGTCFDPARGCVGIPGVCTPGQDQTCNADPTISSLHGFCQDDGSCLCIAGTTRVASGKCS